MGEHKNSEDSNKNIDHRFCPKVNYLSLTPFLTATRMFTRNLRPRIQIYTDDLSLQKGKKIDLCQFAYFVFFKFVETFPLSRHFPMVEDRRTDKHPTGNSKVTTLGIPKNK